MALQEVRRYNNNFRTWHSAYTNMGFLAHWHDEIELIRVRSGKAEITIEKKTYFVSEGDLLICGSGCIHYCDSFHMANTLEFILFDPALIHHSLSPLYLRSHCITRGQLQATEVAGEVDRLFEELPAELTARPTHYQEIVKGLLRVFWYKIQRLLPDDSQQSVPQHANEEHPIQQMIQYMEQHISEQRSLEQVALQFSMSKCYLSRYFKRYTGMNFVVYRNLLRLGQAITLLQSTTHSASEIAFSCGFQDIRTFNRVFRQYTDHSPLDFRRDLNLGAQMIPYSHRRTDQDLIVENDSPVVKLV